MQLSIHNITDEKDIKQLTKFVMRQEQYYPNFYDWIQGKLIPRMLSERYKAIIGVESTSLVGCLIYDTFEDKIEIKNFRIDDKYKNRLLGQFLIRQIELHNKPLITDVTVNNFRAVEFFIKNGFRIIKAEELYTNNQLEYVVSKKAFE